uniref:Uncharacterized protein n=1 Tax=Anguilla anguilla TaxID=7936 RepID=A0A0E9UMF6_ANGAN
MKTTKISCASVFFLTIPFCFQSMA